VLVADGLDGDVVVGVGVGDVVVGCGAGLEVVVVGLGRADFVGVGLADADRLGVVENVVATYGVGDWLWWWVRL
jgi:hypothetical protein